MQAQASLDRAKADAAKAAQEKITGNIGSYLGPIDSMTNKAQTVPLGRAEGNTIIGTMPINGEIKHYTQPQWRDYGASEQYNAIHKHFNPEKPPAGGDNKPQVSSAEAQKRLQQLRERTQQNLQPASNAGGAAFLGQRP